MAMLRIAGEGAVTDPLASIALIALMIGALVALTWWDLHSRKVSRH